MVRVRCNRPKYPVECRLRGRGLRRGKMKRSRQVVELLQETYKDVRYEEKQENALSTTQIHLQLRKQIVANLHKKVCFATANRSRVSKRRRNAGVISECRICYINQILTPWIV